LDSRSKQGIPWAALEPSVGQLPPPFLIIGLAGVTAPARDSPPAPFPEDLLPGVPPLHRAQRAAEAPGRPDPLASLLLAR
jgi:hypothetical protein